MLRPLKIAETVARDIVHDIVDSGLTHGDGLAPEAKMLEHYGVSRESLREGLRLLEAQGLITLRRGPGGGPVVGTVDPANLGRVSTLYYHLVGATYDELFDAWVVAECYLAERAARNPDRKVVRDTLSPYLVEDEQIEDLEAYIAHHTDFHTALGTLAGNKVMQLSLMSIGAIVTHHIAFVDDPRAVRELIHDDHAAIARAVINGQPVKARDGMSDHLMRIRAYYEGNKAGEMLDSLIEWR